MYQIKTNLPDYVLPNLTVNKNDYFVPRAIGDVKETEWGWHSNVLARLLCPMKLVDQFDMDREYVYSCVYAMTNDSIKGIPGPSVGWRNSDCLI